MRAVFIRILVFVILIDLFYMGIGRLYLVQSEEHPPPELQITVETDTDTLVGMGETLLKTKGGCLLCHKITEQGNTRGPDLRGIGSRAAQRRPGTSAEAYLTESLLDPGAYVVEEFAAPGGTSIMPAADQPPADMSPTELKALIAFLQSLGGEVTVKVTAEDVRVAEARKQKPPAAVSTHPGAGIVAAQGCVACHDLTGTARRVGPPLTNVAERLSAAEIRQSIVDPDAVVAEGFTPGLMLQDFAEKLTPKELDQLVGYLSGTVSLAERLAHPAVHLLGLILIFNGGITWTMRRIAASDPATAKRVVLTPPGMIDTNLWLGRQFKRLLVAATLVGVLYLGLPMLFPGPVDEPAPVPARRAAPEQPVPQPIAEQPSAPLDPNTPVSLEDGRAFFMKTCVACHGADATGVPGLGKNMLTSEFIASTSDVELVEFIRRGRPADDPQNTTGVPMPPSGANPSLTDVDMLAIVKFIRSLRD